MDECVPEKHEITSQALGTLLDLTRRTHQASDLSELGFLAVNDSHTLAPYRQGALWLVDEGVKTLSGVVQLEANAPYAQWLDRACRSVSQDNNPHPSHGGLARLGRGLGAIGQRHSEFGAFGRAGNQKIIE
jgi:hypothetical protein